MIIDDVAQARATYRAAVEKGRALGYDYEGAHVYADDVMRKARAVAAQSAEVDDPR